MTDYIIKRNKSAIDGLDEGEKHSLNEILDRLVDKDYWFRYVIIPKSRSNNTDMSDDDFTGEILRYLFKIGKLNELISYLKKKYEYIEMEGSEDTLIIFIDRFW